MSCGCGGQSNMQAMTTNQVNEMLAEARKSAEEQLNELIASAANAAGNANSNKTAQR
jgi:hypothetical protein